MRFATLAAVCVALLAGPVSAQEPTHAFMTASDGVQIHYAELGAGTPVILVHGYTANAEGKWFTPGIAGALAERNRVVAIDARGHGRSDKPHDPMQYGPQMAEDVVELMDHLGIDRAHIHGYSMGGSILTQILARHPGRVITAIYGGSGVSETDPVRRAQVPADPARPDDLPPARGEPWSEYPGFDRTALDAVRAYPWTPEQRAIDLTTIQIPVLAIVGGYDRPNARTHRMARELEDFQMVLLDGETHGSAHFNPRYTEALVEFVREHEPDKTD